ncbi:hypothetical protein EU245_05090 [Lentibacillus lipolyticus]|nr:hypothetical protein EU245_05090 [Lentibacillus lipolyticus]
MIMIAKEWKEFYRSALFIITAGMIIISSWFVLFPYGGMDIPVAFRTGIVSVFQVSVYLLPLLATVYGAFAMAEEKNQRTLPMLLARGMTIHQFVLRKYLSLVTIFAPAILAAYVIAMIPAKSVFTDFPLQEFVLFAVSTIFLAVIFIAIGMLLGSVIGQKLTLVGFIIGTWLAFIYFIDLLLMYWLPNIAMKDVLGFSIIYFLSPLHAVQYFLFTKLDVYEFSDTSVLYDHFTFQSPWLVLIGNMVIWVAGAIGLSILVLKRKGVSHD